MHRFAASPLTSRRRPCCLLWWKGPSAPGISALSRPLSRSPHVCSPTHRPPCCHGRRKDRYRPAGLGFGRAGFAPAGRRTEFLKGVPSFLSNGPALPGRIYQQPAECSNPSKSRPLCSAVWGKMRASVFHLGNADIRIMGMLPGLVRTLLAEPGKNPGSSGWRCLRRWGVASYGSFLKMYQPHPIYLGKISNSFGGN